MNKEKPRKESTPIDESSFTDSSTAMGGKTQQQKTTQKSAQNNEAEGMK